MSATSFPRETYDIIYADPPWKYDDPCKGWSGLCSLPYSSMTEAELRDLPVASLARPDSLLFLWSTPSHLAQALRLMAAWGYEYKTVFVNWIKTHEKSGLDATTPGFYSMSSSEFLLVGKRGRVTRLRGSAAWKPSKAKQVLRAARKAHSAKPSEARERIELAFPAATKRIELFARGLAAPGWDVWGHEAISRQAP
jgi:N6-adenosine-specific RNA methylase IME4